MINFIKEQVKLLLFIAILPIVLIVCFVKWALTGTPIMSDDEIVLAKWAFIIVVVLPSPVWIAIGFWIRHNLKRKNEQKLRVKEYAKNLYDEMCERGSDFTPDLSYIAEENGFNLWDLKDALRTVQNEKETPVAAHQENRWLETPWAARVLVAGVSGLALAYLLRTFWGCWF